jgi:hypothetical protein
MGEITIREPQAISHSRRQNEADDLAVRFALALVECSDQKFSICHALLGPKAP